MLIFGVQKDLLSTDLLIVRPKDGIAEKLEYGVAR
jgi:hypothetical protein